MTNVVSLLEPATPASFDPKLYLAVNPDVAAAGVDAFEHFRHFAEAERRMQLNRELLSGSKYRNDKFKRFQSVLHSPYAASASTFPLTLAPRHYAASEYKAESANAEFGAFQREIESKPDAMFVNVGCGVRNIHFHNCLYLEVYPSISADIIVDPQSKYPLQSESFDGVGCFAVLEHVRQPWKVVEEIERILKPGGRVFIDWPFLQPVHGFPFHFFNATRDGLKSIFADAGFQIETIGTWPHQAPNYAMSWMLSRLLRELPERTAQALRAMPLGQFADQPPASEFWKDIVSQLPDRVIEELACGNSLIATKRIL